MAETSNRKISRKIGEKDDQAVTFTAFAGSPVSSPVQDKIVYEVAAARPAEAAPAAVERIARSPEFLLLAEPQLPDLSRSFRRRLLMQSPTRLYFYWDAGKNPFHKLSRAVGETANYTLVLKLVNLRSGAENIYPVDPAGNWWFEVNADSEYRAEIGFYAVNRPYVRVLSSNVVATPRRNPSPRSAESAEWRVPAEKFARVLDVAGFARDAFDVAIAGDDADAAESATRSAFAELSGVEPVDFAGFESVEIRYAMLALASGVPLAELRGLISDGLFEFLSSLPGLSGEIALAALQSRFEFDSDDFELEEESASTVYGASLVHFPRKVKTIPRGREAAIPGSRPPGSPARRP